MAQAEEVILRVSLDEGKTMTQLNTLVLGLEATRKAQQELSAARKAGKVSDEEFASQTVALQQQLKAQKTEQTALTKNLELFRGATDGTGTSYRNLQSQLSLAQRQFQQLDGSAENSTEATKALSEVIDGLRDTLRQTDETQGLFIRSVGRYPKGEELAPLIQQLVRLQEVQQAGILTTEQANKAAAAEVGFKQQIAQAGAAAGLSYEETTAKVKEYGDTIRPATTALVQLEREQEKVGAGSEAFTRLGFQIRQARKQIEETPVAVKGVTNTITELDQTTGVFGGRVAMLKQRFATAQQGIELAKGGFTGLKGAIAATGIGALILALVALGTYFVSTDEGAEDLSAILSGLKGVFSVLQGVVIGAGKELRKLFTDPKEAGKDFLNFLESQLINRVKSFGVIWDAIRNGDAKGLANGIIQFNTGIEDGIGKVQRFAAESARAGAVAYDLARAQNELEDDQRKSLNTLEKNKNLIDKLVLSARDRTLSEKQRLANLDEAGKLEEASLKITTGLAERKYRIAKATNDEAERTGKTSDELRDAAAQAEAELTRLAGQSLSLQQSIQNRRSVLLQQSATEEKALAEKAAERRLALRKDVLALEAQMLDRQLLFVKANSDEEISLLQRQLRNGYQAELTVKNLTVSAKRVIDAKYANDSLKLAQDFAKQRTLAAYDAELSAVAQELALLQKGSAAETELRREAIDAQLRKELAALDKRKDNAAEEARLRATAAKALTDVNYGAALAQLDAFLGAQRQAIEESNSAGKLSEAQYNQAVTTADQIAAGARLQLARDFKQDTTALEKQAADAKIADLKRVTAADKAEQAKRVAAAEQFGGALAGLFADTVNQTGATLQDFVGKALILIIDSMEKTIIAAQVKIIAEALATPQSAATFGVAGFAQAAATIAAVTIAAEAVKARLAPAPKQFAAGTVLGGASHAQGGVQLYSRSGYHFGEAERDEIILTKGVYQNPALRPLASMLNVLGGGKPLVPGRFMALGGVASTMVRDSLRGEVVPGLDYDRLAAAMSHVKVKATISDVKAGLARDAFTQDLASA